MNSTAPSKVTIAVGVLTTMLGCIPLLAMAGILPRASAPTADPTPAWMGWVIGAVFVGAGLIAIMRGALGGASESSGDLPATAPCVFRAANDTIGFGIVWGMAAMFTWAAFGPGPRHFSIGFDGLWIRGFAGSDIMGRIAFGFGAILFWCATAAFAVTIARRWRR
jgi:hypothetical protein